MDTKQFIKNYAILRGGVNELSEDEKETLAEMFGKKKDGVIPALTKRLKSEVKEIKSLLDNAMKEYHKGQIDGHTKAMKHFSAAAKKAETLGAMIGR